jgi:hypothetical protein
MLWAAQRHDHTLPRLLESLRLWHVDRRTPRGDEVAARQALVAALIFEEGLSREEAAAAVGRTRRTLDRDLEMLELVFGVMREREQPPQPRDAAPDAVQVDQRELWADAARKRCPTGADSQ